jgi:hypothetical protein
MPEPSMRDLVEVRITCERWVLTAMEEALGEAAESAREDGDAGLNRWADGLDTVDVRNGSVRVLEARPGPPGASWSWREMRYPGEAPSSSDATEDRLVIPPELADRGESRSRVHKGHGSDGRKPYAHTQHRNPPRGYPAHSGV